MAAKIKSTRVTSGRVVYSRKVQLAQYEPEGLEVELSFIVGEDEVVDDAVGEVIELAKAQVEAHIGQSGSSRRRRFRRRGEED